MRAFERVALWLALGAASGCANLEPMAAGQCGNGVVEPESGEDCDRFPEGGCRPPGVPGQCRLDCSPGPDGTPGSCPLGWGCGTDGICRRPTGKFVRAGVLDVGGQARLATGDFDGDGRADVVASARGLLAVWYADASGAVTKSASVPAGSGVPAIGQPTSDRLADLVLAGEGLVVARGRADHTLQPTINAPFTLPPTGGLMVALDARPEEIDAQGDKVSWSGDELLALSGPAMVYISPEGTGELLLLLPADASTVVGDVVTADLLADDDAPCKEIAVAFEGESWVWVYTPCLELSEETWGWNGDGKQPKVELPKIELGPGMKVQGRMLAADANSDGHLDLLVPVAAGLGLCPSRTLVAYGLGDGTFHSQPLLPEPPDQGDSKAGCVSNPDEKLWDGILGAADLNGDGRIDLITPRSILVSTNKNASNFIDSIIYRHIDIQPGGWSWDWAHVADFNNNGLLDVVVASSGLAQLGFLNGAGGGAFSELFLPTGAGPSHLAVGDFDGDLLLDVALSEIGPHEEAGPGVERGDWLSVAFGSPSGAPSPPTRMGRLAHIEQLAGGKLAMSSYDAAADLVVVARSEDGASSSAAVLCGSGNRLLVSPFFLDRPLGGVGPDRPLAVAVGQFDGDDAGHLDLAAVGLQSSEEESALWLLPATGEAALDPATASFSAPMPADPEAVDVPTPLLGAVDLDRDSVDELVVLSARGSGPSGGSVLVARAKEEEDKEGKRKWRWQLGPQVQTDEAYFSYDALSGPGEGGAKGGKEDADWDLLRYEGHLEVADLDGEEGRELVALSYSMDDTLPYYRTSVVVFRSDGSGSLEVDGRIVLENVDDVIPVGFALGNFDADPQLEIAVVAADGVRVADIDLAARRLAQPFYFYDYLGTHAVAAGDVNGDGVADLVVAAGDQVHILLGVPERP